MQHEKFAIPRNFTLSQSLQLLYSIVINQYRNMTSQVAALKQSKDYKKLHKVYKTIDLLLGYLNDGLRKIEKGYSVNHGWGQWINKHSEYKVIFEDIQILGNDIRIMRRETLSLIRDHEKKNNSHVFTFLKGKSIKSKDSDEEDDKICMQQVEKIKHERQMEKEKKRLEQEEKAKEKALHQRELDVAKEKELELRIKQQVKTQMDKTLEEEKEKRRQIEIENEKKLILLKQKMAKKKKEELAINKKSTNTHTLRSSSRKSFDLPSRSNSKDHIKASQIINTRRSLDSGRKQQIQQPDINKAATVAWNASQKYSQSQNTRVVRKLSPTMHEHANVERVSSPTSPSSASHSKQTKAKHEYNKPVVRRPVVKSPVTKSTPNFQTGGKSHIKLHSHKDTSNSKISHKSSSRSSSPSVATVPLGVERQSNSNVAEKSPSAKAMDKRISGIMSSLQGVDEGACQQIVNDIMITNSKIYWDDIAGLDKAKNSLKEAVVYPFLRPDLFRGLREPIRGMLLFGPPGTGKTMIAKAIATESNSTFFSISASSLLSKYLGESEKLVRALFYLAKRMAPSIIFIDEIDSLLGNRSDNENESSRRIKTELLIQWSDLSSATAREDHNSESKNYCSNNENDNRVLVLSATNLPWVIDEAARRRFTRRLYIPLPEYETRLYHLRKLMSRQRNGLTDEDFEEIAHLIDGYSGSDITSLAKEAAMEPIRDLGDKLMDVDFDKIRPVNKADFIRATTTIKKSVSKESLKKYEDWAIHYGSAGS